MPDWTGGFAKVAVTSAVVAGAAFGVPTPSHAVEQPAPVAVAHALGDSVEPVDVVGPVGTAVPVHPVADEQKRGRF
ncbi:hypothetical protein ACIQ9P_27070 [Kitasatospora sp. NPDC094019]|uniref:hypothetical protein n=1 Tax=Kitasatospora sp. NPDC094019 TaxID=3364091 RepID=UPI00380FD17D